MVSERPYKIQDNDDLEYMMVVARNTRRSTQLYVIKSHIEGRDNLQEEHVDEEDKKRLFDIQLGTNHIVI